MPINFQTLRVSENKLRKMLVDYFEHVTNGQKALLTVLKKKVISDEDYAKLCQIEKENNEFEAKILEEASWVISKDVPRANHLRFIIAIIRSIRDLERMGDCMLNVASYFHSYKKIKTKIWDIVADIEKRAMEVVKVVYDNIQEGPQQTPEFYSQTILPVYKKFNTKYLANLRKVGRIAFAARSSKKVQEQNLHAFAILKNIERDCDHALNVFENFIYIKEPDYYFTKESRREQKNK